PLPSFSVLPDPVDTVAPNPSAAEPRRPALPAPAVASSTASGPPPSGERYGEAQRLEATRPDDALVIYRELAGGTGPWAMNALFAAGRLEAERGHRESARRLLREYEARFPTGPNIDDAQRLIVEMR